MDKMAKQEHRDNLGHFVPIDELNGILKEHKLGQVRTDPDCTVNSSVDVNAQSCLKTRC